MARTKITARRVASKIYKHSEFANSNNLSERLFYWLEKDDIPIEETLKQIGQLIKEGVDANKTVDGKKATSVVQERNQSERLPLLLKLVEAGATFDKLDEDDGKNYFNFLESNDYWEIFVLMINNKYPIDQVASEEGDEASHLVLRALVSKKNVETKEFERRMSYLIKKGASINFEGTQLSEEYLHNEYKHSLSVKKILYKYLKTISKMLVVSRIFFQKVSFLSEPKFPKPVLKKIVEELDENNDLVSESTLQSIIDYSSKFSVNKNKTNNKKKGNELMNSFFSSVLPLSSFSTFNSLIDFFESFSLKDYEEDEEDDDVGDSPVGHINKKSKMDI